MNYKTDFHIHSFFSDGKSKPTDIVRMYKEKDYDIIAITDHDNIDGINEAIIAGEALKIIVYPGIEFSTVDENGRELHILGYRFDLENEELLKKLEEIKKDRTRRNSDIIDALSKMGYKIAIDDLKERPSQKYIGKPHFARALKKLGYIQNESDAFKDGDFLNSQEVKQIKKQSFHPEEAIKLINNAGGMAVLAHPMKIKNSKGAKEPFVLEELEKLILELKKKGLKGLECFHPSASEENAMMLVDIAGKFHLHITEGSDFHE